MDTAGAGTDMVGNDPAGPELRLGVVMTGGVSLAVWMGGVAYELDRLRRCEGDYGALLAKTGLTPVVDVTVGTSAGGLNGTVLASAEAWGSKLTLSDVGPGLNMRTVWRDQGDLGKLLRGVGDQDPPSLLRGDGNPSFLQSVTDALTTLSRAEGDAAPPGVPTPDALPRHLIATTTLWTPSPATYEDSLGTAVPVQTSLGLFHFRCASDVNQFGHSQADRATAVGRLARAARSSASFPFAFEPAMINVTNAASEPFFGGDENTRIADFSGDTYVLDGGLVDNEPLQQCLNLIEQQPADVPVTRVVLFVAPLADPGGQRAPAMTSTPTLLQVGEKTLFIPRDRDIAAQLDEISVRRIHQERLAKVSSALARQSDGELAALATLVQAGDLASSFRRYDRLDRATKDDRLRADDQQERLQLKQAALNVQSLLGRALTESSWAQVQPHRREVATVIAVATGPSAGDLAPQWNRVAAAFDALVERAGAVGPGSDLASEVVALHGIGQQAEPTGDAVDVARAGLLVLELLQSMVTDPQVRSPQQIEFVEISSATPNCFDDRVTSTSKLTGVQLDHFGAFYLSSWRMNDWMWGRLDGSWRLVELLLHLRGEPATADAVRRVARPFQLQILREELPSIAEQIQADQIDGATTSPAEQTFLGAFGAWMANPADDTLLEQAFVSCTVGTERIEGQVGSEHFAGLITQAGSVAAGALAAQPQATALKPATSGVRSVLRATNMLVRHTSSPAVFAVVGFLAAAAGSLLGVGIAQSDTALAVACAVTLVALLLASILRTPDALVELVGGLGALGLLVLSIAALARGATGWQVLGVALGALAGLLLVGLLLPSQRWRRSMAAIGLLALAAVVGVGIWVWVGNELFVPATLHGVTCSVPTTAPPAGAVSRAPSTPSGAPCTDLYHSGIVTGAVLVGAGALALIVVIAFCVVRRKRAG